MAVMIEPKATDTKAVRAVPELIGQGLLSHIPRVWSLTTSGDDYSNCLYPALRAAGADVRDGVWSGRWLLRHIDRGDVICLHWPSFLYYDEAAPVGTWVSLTRFLVLMLLVRARGGRIFWIAHNLYPHNGGRGVRAHRVGRRIVVALCSWIGVHSDAAATRIRAEFVVRSARIVRLEHGNWVGWYRNEMSREEARRRLGVAPDAFLFLFVGLCKEYKNLVHLVHGHKQVQDDSRLWIAGLFQSRAYFDKVQAAAAGSDRITIRNGRIASEDMQVYLNACDVVVLPYTEILTSGAAMLALSFGRPVLAPRLPSLEELVNSDCGVLYDPVADGALTRAMRTVQSQRFDSARIVDHALQFTWERSARSFVQAVASRG